MLTITLQGWIYKTRPAVASHFLLCHQFIPQNGITQLMVHSLNFGVFLGVFGKVTEICNIKAHSMQLASLFYENVTFHKCFMYFNYLVDKYKKNCIKQQKTKNTYLQIMYLLTKSQLCLPSPSRLWFQINSKSFLSVPGSTIVLAVFE